MDISPLGARVTDSGKGGSSGIYWALNPAGPGTRSALPLASHDLGLGSSPSGSFFIWIITDPSLQGTWEPKQTFFHFEEKC